MQCDGSTIDHVESRDYKRMRNGIGLRHDNVTDGSDRDTNSVSKGMQTWTSRVIARIAGGKL